MYVAIRLGIVRTVAACDRQSKFGAFVRSAALPKHVFAVHHVTVPLPKECFSCARANGAISPKPTPDRIVFHPFCKCRQNRSSRSRVE